MNLAPIRRSLRIRGLTPAFAIPEAAGGRLEEASIAKAALLEGPVVSAIPVGLRSPWPEPVAYLDGIQRSELVGYLGSAPLLIAEIAAAVRERRGPGGSGRAGDRGRRDPRGPLALARPSSLAAAGVAVAGLEPVALPEDDPPHPIRDLLNAARALDRARGALEIQLGSSYRARTESWLVVDGVLSESPRWAADHRMVAISKSHSILPFDGEDLERYLRLPAHHRSSIYVPATRSLAPVRSWGLRLWPWEGRDLLHGLVRVEVAPANGTPETADLISSWILADRAPISAPARRWDRVLQGIQRAEG